MRYIPHTPEETSEMLATIGVSKIDDLFSDIPQDLILRRQLELPGALDEHAILKELAAIGEKNSSLTSYIGAGVYEHYVPSIVMEIISRGEFLSAYTPYQPEASQGYLQTIYEFQSMICEITGMDVANASMYDGATALAEACIMASGIKNKTKILLSNSVHPHYRACVQTFAEPADCTVTVCSDDELASNIDETTACVAVQYPDFFGRITSPKQLLDAARAKDTMSIVVSDPVALGVLKTPGEMGADVVVGEAQSLGVPVGFGGPMVGYFCVRREFIRAIPGRIVGRTQDDKGRRGFVMTLRTREQDIRREKATSNICTNQALMGLVATVWMTALGKSGFRELAETCVQKAHFAASELCRIPGVSLKFPEQPFAFEFTLDVGQNATVVAQKLREQGILAGLPLGDHYPELKNCLLIAVTETKSKQEIITFATELAKVVN